jgi:hypothetical protein
LSEAAENFWDFPVFRVLRITYEHRFNKINADLEVTMPEPKSPGASTFLHEHQKKLFGFEQELSIEQVWFASLFFKIQRGWLIKACLTKL